MGPLPSVSSLQVDGFIFSPAVQPPGSSKTHFLGGAGVRCLEIQGKLIKFTAIGVYLEAEAIPSLAGKWKGKTGTELTECLDFFRDVVTGPFQKFTRVTMILPLTGQQYSEKVTENCVAYWKSIGTYTQAEAAAVEKFKEVFKNETFPPGSAILFTQAPSGSLTIAFSKDSSIPEQGTTVIENKQLAEAVLESIIGKHGVSPEAKQSLATRVSQLLDSGNIDIEKVCTEGEKAAIHLPLSVSELQVEGLVFPLLVKPLGSSKMLFLGGAGSRGLEIQGKFVKFTAIGVYLEGDAISFLAAKWKGKTGKELADCVNFYRDIVAGPFEKFTRVTTILPLTGQQYSEKVTENCVAYWKAIGSYTEAEAAAVEKFNEVFKDEIFPPGASILFTQAPSGSLTIGFSKDGSIPEQSAAVIENKQLAQAVLESIIGEHGVSPAAKQSLANRISELLKSDVEKAV